MSSAPVSAPVSVTVTVPMSIPMPASMTASMAIPVPAYRTPNSAAFTILSTCRFNSHKLPELGALFAAGAQQAAVLAEITGPTYWHLVTDIVEPSQRSDRDTSAIDCAAYMFMLAQLEHGSVDPGCIAERMCRDVYEGLVAYGYVHLVQLDKMLRKLKNSDAFVKFKRANKIQYYNVFIDNCVYAFVGKYPVDRMYLARQHGGPPVDPRMMRVIHSIRGPELTLDWEALDRQFEVELAEWQAARLAELTADCAEAKSNMMSAATALVQSPAPEPREPLFAALARTTAVVAAVQSALDEHVQLASRVATICARSKCDKPKPQAVAAQAVAAAVDQTELATMLAKLSELVVALSRHVNLA